MNLWQSMCAPPRGVLIWRSLAGSAALMLACLVGTAPAFAQNAYITNEIDSTVSVATNMVIGSPIPVGSGPVGVAVTPDGSTVYITNQRANTVSVIDTATNTVIGSPIPVGSGPWGVAVTPDGSAVYVANFVANTVSVIDTATNMVIGSPIPVGSGPVGVAVTPDGSTATNMVIGSPIPVGSGPVGVAVTPDGSTVYITNQRANTVSVIDTATNMVIGSPIPVGSNPLGVAVTPDGSTVYVAHNAAPGTVSVIDTATNTVIATIPVGILPWGVAVTPDGSTVYVANSNASTISVIDTASNTVIDPPIPVGRGPTAFGKFIGPAPAVHLTSGDHCNGVFTGSFDGNITVSAGQSCVFVPPCEIERSVTVNGGTFNLACTVEGNIIQDNGNLILRHKARVHGTVQISGTSAFTVCISAT